MGKRIQKLKAKQPRAIRTSREAYKKSRYQLLEGVEDDYYLLISVGDKCFKAYIKNFIPEFNIVSNKDLKISFEAKPLPENPIIDKIAKDIIKGLDSIK